MSLILCLIIAIIIVAFVVVVKCSKINSLKTKKEYLENKLDYLEKQIQDANQELSTTDIKLNNLKTQYNSDIIESDNLTTEIIKKQKELYTIKNNFTENYYEVKGEHDKNLDLLKQEYDGKIQALVEQYAEKQESLELDYEARTACLEENLDVLKTIVEEYRQKQQALVKVYLDEEQQKLKEDANSIIISAQDRADIKILKDVATRISKADVVNKIIWANYYQQPFTELLDRLFQRNKICGIYKITNKVNHKVYIGQSKNIRERMIQHVKSALEIGTIAKNNLYTAMKDEDINNFTFELLEECTSEQLNDKEKYWIQFFQSNIYGYNMKL